MRFRNPNSSLMLSNAQVKLICVYPRPPSYQKDLSSKLIELHHSRNTLDLDFLFITRDT